MNPGKEQESEIKGRIPEESPDFSNQDICKIDKQEGNMDHGETGGNFNPKDDKNDEENS